MEERWPCNKCRNVAECAYKRHWVLGGENYFCPALNAYIDQDNVRQKEVQGLKDKSRDRMTSRGYLDVYKEHAEHKNEVSDRISAEIRLMPEDTMLEQRAKAIACMGFFGMRQETMAIIFRMSKSAFYRIFRGK